MDADRFDAWTRRPFGLAAGGLAVVLLGGMRSVGPEGPVGPVCDNPT